MVYAYKSKRGFHFFSVYWSLHLPKSTTVGSLILKTFLPHSGNFTFDFQPEQEIYVDKICDDSNSNNDLMAYRLICNSTHHDIQCESRSLCIGNCNTHYISTSMSSLVQYNIHSICAEAGGFIVLVED